MKRAVLIIFVLAVTGLGAQSNDLIDRVLDQEEIQYKLGVYLILTAGGHWEEPAVPEDSLEVLKDLGWSLPGKFAEDSLSAGDAAFLIMHSLDIPGGIMYSLFPSRRYAYKELVFLGIVESAGGDKRPLSGRSLLQILGKAMEIKNNER